MKRAIPIVCIWLSLVFTTILKAQDDTKGPLYQKFIQQLDSGKIVQAEISLRTFLESGVSLTRLQLSGAYNNLGALNILLGRYNRALELNMHAEELLTDKDLSSKELANIYINRARILTLQRSFTSAIEYLEKGIRLFNNLEDADPEKYKNLASSYLNIGIAYYEVNNIVLAQKYLERSAELRTRYKIAGLAFVYLNMAKTFAKTGNNLKAEEYFLKSISSFKKEYGESYYRLPEAFFNYGILLRSEAKYGEALSAHKGALAICLKNYGQKNTLVSLAYKYIGDDFLQTNNVDSSLYYYQKGLIAVTHGFSNSDFLTNPSIDSSLFDINLLDNLKSKAHALSLFAGIQNNPDMRLEITKKSFETMELGVQLIDRIRNNYMSEESRIYLAENEKETYVFATNLAQSLYTLNHDVSAMEQMYRISQQAKSSVLRNEITDNEVLYSEGIPDSLREKKNNLSGNIAAYTNLIIEENRKGQPDSNKISRWKDALFEINREKEKVTDKIAAVFPQYHDLLRKTEPLSLSMIQKHLSNDETVVDYMLSNNYSGGKRKLYVFLISHNSLNYQELTLDSLFIKYAQIIHRSADPLLGQSNFTEYTSALNYMYINLITPVEKMLKGTRLIIIPDEEIGWLPFDAFLKDRPLPGQNGYEGLNYLINYYTISYGYSSSLLSGKAASSLKEPEVLAFAPDYSTSDDLRKNVNALHGTGEEIKSIYKWFRGENFSGTEATRENFISSLKNKAIFHLAMHAMTDSTDSRFSCILFDSHINSSGDNKFFNYEISLTKINSPMVVLSACNSGSGTLFYGEGMMSLARSFTLAGASSVIRTAWEINDATSADIMGRFYYNLSKGKDKDDAMRLAKLEYLKNSSPLYSSPYYWAAYEVLGDNSPVTSKISGYLILTISVILVLALMIILYLRKRRIFSERSL